MTLLYDRYDDNEEQERSEKRNLRAGVRVNSRVKVAVERNAEIVPRSRYADTPLESGDALEIVHLIGGG